MLSDTLYTLPPGSRILVTGCNGFIGSHVVDQLLMLSYLVRGTVREPKPWLNEFFDQKYGKGKFESFILSNLDSEVDCEKAVEGASGVIHMAADVSMNPDPNVVIPNAVKAMQNILKAASKWHSVKQVVLTSSSTAAYTPSSDGERTTITQDTWNDAAVAAAWDAHAPPRSKGYFVYVASKTETERMAFKWVQEHKPSFTLNTVLPALTFGKILAPGVGGSTQSFVTNMLKGDGSAMTFLPPQWFVNVVDVAGLHVAALLSPSVKSERIFAFAASQNWTEVIRILRKLRPENSLIPQEPEGEAQDLKIVEPSKRAEEILKSFYDRPGWVSLEESIAEGICDC